jgi:hypothetical protein
MNYHSIAAESRKCDAEFSISLIDREPNNLFQHNGAPTTQTQNYIYNNAR